MKTKKIATVFDIGLDQRLIAQLVNHHNAELVIIPSEVDKKESFEACKASHLKQVKMIMKTVDGVIFAGNQYDIDPVHYCENNIHPKTQNKINTDPTDIRFDVEKEMLLCAIKREISIVAICAGMQLVNVVLGGTLVQHLPDVIDSVLHRAPYEFGEKKIKDWEKVFKNQLLTSAYKNIYNDHPHCIKVKPDSMLGKLYKRYTPHVDLDNVRELSMHHQGCFKENLSPRLTVVATSSDGLIEAVELIDYPSLFIATQFHFEYNVGNIANGIFKELVSN
jgi:putative glutamine amidotransferase